MSMAAATHLDLESLPECELVVLAQQGDLAARELLAVRYRTPAFRLAMQLLGRPEEAKDVAQDSMLRFFSSLDRFEAHRPVLPWLFRIVHNRVRDLERQRRRRRVESLEGYLEKTGLEPVSAAPGPGQRLQRHRLQQRVWQALNNLSTKHREILVLRDYQDLTYVEIAAVLGIPKGTVMSRLHAARCSLRRRMRELDGPDSPFQDPAPRSSQ
jgi:RNA polymerase sigma-70 factor (ECF subfamily)